MRLTSVRPKLLMDLATDGVGSEHAEELLSYLESALATGRGLLFSEFVAWRARLDAERGDVESLRASLERLSKCLGAYLEGEALETALEYVGDARTEAAASKPAPDSFLDGTAHADLARQYFDLLLEGHRREATRLILDSVEAGISVREIYLDVFQPCQWEVGRLWQLNRLSMGQEHFCTACTQSVMAQLYDKIFSGKRKGRRLLATSVSGELHEIGVRMVADFFEMEGWDTYYVGANMPTAETRDLALREQPNVMAISVTLPAHFPHLSELIGAVRQGCPATRILVGGHAFTHNEDLWERFGADGYARDAEQAVALANGLVADA